MQLFVKVPSDKGRLVVVSVPCHCTIKALTALVRRRALEEASGAGDGSATGVPSFVLTTRTGKWLDRGYLTCADVGLVDQQQLEMRPGAVRLQRPPPPVNDADNAITVTVVAPALGHDAPPIRLRLKPRRMCAGHALNV